MDLATLPDAALKALRPEMQMIFQDPFGSLNPRMTVQQIVAEPLVIHRMASGSALEDRVMEMLRRVGVRPEYRTRYPHAFSGGQRQRIGIARALVMRPSPVVADEAVSALDVSVQAQVVNLLAELQEEFGLTYLFVAHDLSIVRHLCSRVAVMLEGQFESGFKGKDSPLMEAQAPAIGHGHTARTAASAKAAPFGRVIDHSPASARLVVIASNEVFTDQAMSMIGQVRGSRDFKAAQFMQNLVDWSLEDQGLLGIRSRGQFARTLAPITREAQMAWEYGNYALALGGLALVWGLHRRRRIAAVRRYTQLLEGV